MQLEEKHKKLALWLICGLLIFRMVGDGVLGLLGNALATPEAVTLLLYLQTGRVIRPAAPSVTEENTEPTDVTLPQETVLYHPSAEGVLAVFAPEDASLVKVNSVCGYDADVEDYLSQTISWNLKQDAPTVLIVHSHGSESYTKKENYQESTPYRTHNIGYNVVSIGDRLVQVLETGGVGAVHDRQLHDSPSYSNAYGNSRSSIEGYLQQHPSIRLVLDIHRDSVENSSGEQMRFATSVDGKSVAQLMLVVGTDASGLNHPDWPENMSLAVKLHAQLEKNCPGICRPISFRSQRFNQDLSPGALIVEVGAAGNTRQEALYAVEQLGQAILDMTAGATMENEP